MGVVGTGVVFGLAVRRVLVGVWLDVAWCPSNGVWQKIHEKWCTELIDRSKKCRRCGVVPMTWLR